MITRILLVINTLFCLLFAQASLSNSKWDRISFECLKLGEKFGISMCSGFFINNNHIVTNRHVVERCRNIAVRGAVAPAKAKLILVDPQLDLALLHSPTPPRMVPYLQINYNQMCQK